VTPGTWQRPAKLTRTHLWTGRPRGSHPRAPTERSVTVSRHSALLISVRRRSVGLDLLTRLLPDSPPGRPVARANKPRNEPAPSLHPHYRSFGATTSRSASRVPRRYSTSPVSAVDALPLTHPARHRRHGRAVSAPAFPRSVQEPQTRLAPPTCRTPPGPYSGTRQAYPGSSVLPPVPMPTKTFRHLNSGSLALTFLVPT
jgi:hypothetical protein